MSRLQTLTAGVYEHDDGIEDEVEKVLRHLTPFKIHPSLLNLETAQAEGAYGTVWRGMLYSIAANQIPREATGRIDKSIKEGQFSWFTLEGETKTRHVVLCETAVAVKKLKLLEDTSAADVKRRFAREMHVWSTLDHPNIVKFLGFHLDLDNDAAWMISFWNKKGSLQTYLSRNQLPRIAAMDILEGVALGLAYLHGHSPPIVHGDIKPGNVLITGQEEAQLCDFGLAEILHAEDTRTTTSQFRGSILWSSPELLNGSRHSTASDVWAFGVLSYQVANNGRLPFHKNRLDNLAYMKCVIEDQLPTTLADLPQQRRALVSVVGNCWSMEPSDRPHIQTCYEHIRSINTAVLDARTESYYHRALWIWDITHTLIGLTLWIAGGVHLRFRNIPVPQWIICVLPIVYIAPPAIACGLVRPRWVLENIRDGARYRAKSTLNGKTDLAWWARLFVCMFLGVFAYSCIALLSVGSFTISGGFYMPA